MSRIRPSTAPGRRSRPRFLAGIGILVTAALLLLTACEEQITDNRAGVPCAGPDAISANGRFVLVSPTQPGPIRLLGRGGATPAVRTVGAEGYGTAVDATGSVAAFFSRRSDDGVIWRMATGGTTILPKPAGATISIPTSISDDGRHVGVTAAAVRGGPMTGHVYDVHTGRLAALPGVGPITQLLLSGSGRIVYTAGTDGIIRRTDRIAGTTKTIATVSAANPSPIQSTTRAGRYLVYNTQPDNTNAIVRIWDENTSTIMMPPVALRGRRAFDQVEISNDGTRLTATIFDATGEGRRILSMQRTGGAATTIATVTDGGRAVISADGSIIAYCRPSGANGLSRDIFARID